MKIYYDFETTNRNPYIADILESCFIIKKKDEEIIINDKIKLKAYDYYLDKSALEFNKIYNIEDYNRHQAQAVELKEHLNKLLKYVKDTPDLIGWNSSRYDDIILQRAFIQIGVKIKLQTSFNLIDLKSKFNYLKTKNRWKYFTLEMAYNTFYKKKLNFHTAKDDVIAITELDRDFYTTKE